MAIPHILRTKITPPRITTRTLIRPRLTKTLSEALHYRLTLLQAGAGHGKSTALAALADIHRPLIWYQATEEDNDPLVFLLHLCHATRLALPDLAGLPFPLLEAWDVTHGALPASAIVDQYLNALSEGLAVATLFILDDTHLVVGSTEIAHILDRLIGLSPPDLHILLAGRPPLRLPNLARWQARGEVLSLDQKNLLFNTKEVTQLFTETYGYDLTSDEVESLTQATEGWAITLQLIWQSLRSGAAASVQEALTRPANSLESLFEVLAQEVFGQQPADIQEFLRISATLRVMTPQACDALRGSTDSTAMLKYLQRQELFVVDLGGDSLRYHHIFHRFLRQMTAAQHRHTLHNQAAEYFKSISELDTAVYHQLKAQNHVGAADLLVSYGDELLAMGRLDTLATYLAELPPATLHQHPILLSYLGDLARLHSQFQEGLGWYQQAEAIWRERGLNEGIGRALRGQARVYLDTVNPSRAEELLQQALRLSDGTADREAQARLYELLAENKLNAGKPEEAEGHRQQANALRQEGPHDSELLYRVLVRTGRLEDARKKMEVRAAAEQKTPVQTPRAHRETQLLLSIIYAFQGEPHKAYQAALDGTRRGVELNSPFVIAVGHMRQGHGLMLLPGAERYELAREQFEKAVEISRTLAVPRLRVEAYWGLCRAFGYQGDLVKAHEMAQRGIEIANQAGDEWIASLIRLALGASFTLAQRFEAASEWLGFAARGFQECSDPFGSAATQLWQCLGWFSQNDKELLSQMLPTVLAKCQEHNSDYLLTRPTLLGPPSERLWVPLLIHARGHGWETTYVRHLLQAMGLVTVTIHPGYRLNVRTLGTFQTRRGDDVIPAKGWRREKTRQLFQLMLTYRNSPLDREQILEFLWPDTEPITAQRNFKVALSTLLNVLEPFREPGSESAFILREGKVYGLRPGADIGLDAEEFLSSVKQAEETAAEGPEKALAYLEKAVDLYQGIFLPEARYENWATEEREHLAVRFLQVADQLSELYLEHNRAEDTIHLAQRILTYDNCWERAYRHLMKAYGQLGDHGQIARIYQRCIQTLREELDVSPSPETEALYSRLTEI